MTSPPQAVATPNGQLNAQSRTRILLIDDDEGYLYLCKRYLHSDSASNHTVISVTSIAQALVVFEVDTFDCVIVDYCLPDGYGTDAIVKLRENAKKFMPPCIVLTAEGGEKAATSAVRSEASDFMTKDNVTKESLCRAVRNSIEKGQLLKTNITRMKELEIANGLLLKRNQEIQRFYHTVSHEVKTPLTAITEFVSIVHDGLAGEVVEEQKTILQYALEGCEQIKMHFNELLELSRFETGKMTVELSECSIYSVFDHCIVASTPAACSKDITLQIDDQRDLPLVMMQSNRIIQVLSNLINNAIKFTGQGGEVNVSSQLSEDGTRLRLSVTDTGCGIPASDLSRIFDRLYQITPASDCKDTNGLGLGLSIASEIVSLHGSKIDVESTEGKGSTFSFELMTSDAAERPDLLEKAA